MAKVCCITGARVVTGGRIHRKGLAKKKKGVGRHVTKVVKRKFSPNLHQRRVWVPELGEYVLIKVSARGLKTISKRGAFRALQEAGILEVVG
jgi:large subunit ribosomal protein L28